MLRRPIKPRENWGGATECNEYGKVKYSEIERKGTQTNMRGTTWIEEKKKRKWQKTEKSGIN